MHRTVFLSVAAVWLLWSDGYSQASDSLSFNGFITGSTGVPIDNPAVEMTFTLYKGGTPVWTETHPTVNVDDGIFNVLLGRWSDLDTLAFNTPMELGVSIEGGPELVPRTPLAAAAYAKAMPGLYTYFRPWGGLGGTFNVVGGGPGNVVAPSVVGATIGGGGGKYYSTPVPNKVLAEFGTVSGGSENQAGGGYSTVGGGNGNLASGLESTVSGGSDNEATGSRSTIAGGRKNKATESRAAIGGGVENVAGQGATISGGYKNMADFYSSIGGGSRNSAGSYSTVGGGNTNHATGGHSVIPGGANNVASGSYSFAAGNRAKALHSGTFVWNSFGVFGDDSLETTSTGQFLIGGANVGIRTNNPQGHLHVSGGSGDGVIVLEADINNTTEHSNPIMRFRQDGGTVGANVGFAELQFGSNHFGIGRRYNGIDYDDTFVIQTSDGDVGIGTTSPGNHRLHVENNGGSGTSTATIYAENTSTSAGIAGMFQTNGTDATVVIANEGSGDLIRAFAPGLRFAVRNNGDVRADGTFASPATDLAELFEVEGQAKDYEPGDVLVISDRTDRTVEKSSVPTSQRVAGVYATKPGVVLGTPVEGRTVPMGVVGVLPTKVCGENGPIRRGDLLVTSSKPGHAMKALPVRVEDVDIYPLGAVLGKALEPFDGNGEGMIDVLVGVR